MAIFASSFLNFIFRMSLVAFEDVGDDILFRGKFLVKFKESRKAILNRLIIKYDDLVYQLDQLFFMRMESRKHLSKLSH